MRRQNAHRRTYDVLYGSGRRMSCCYRGRQEKYKRPAAIVAALIALHAPSGKTIYLNGGEVMAITDGGPPLTTPGCKSDVLVHDKWFCVKETPEEVKALIDNSAKD